MTSTAGSTTLLGRPVRRAAVVTHGRLETIGAAVERVREVAAQTGVEILLESDELVDVDLAVVLGGDGTMLRALTRFLGARVPVLGVNFGRVGFLSSMTQGELESGLTRVFSGEYDVVELPTLDVETADARHVAVNDAVVTSGELGRMVELEWAVGGEDLGRQPCDGVICSTPSGSTAYNLSNGGPVLVWGIDAMAITFVAPHSLHARPLVVPRGRDLVVSNRTADVPVAVLVDGHRVADASPRDGEVTIRLGEVHSLLATLPEATFVRRYRQSFAS
ncbi:MAG: NAD(+)/NADH kinase [Gaiellaceae bacterium]